MDERLKKVLVVYSTISGCTTTIAKRIGSDLIAYQAQPRVVSVEEMPIIDRSVDVIIFGSSMRLGKFHHDAREWLQDNLDIIEEVPTAFFSVGLRSVSSQAGGVAQAERELNAVVSSLGTDLHPVGSVVLPGWKRSEGFNPMEKLALRVYPLADGDYRDWDKVDAWVRQIAPVLLSNGPDGETFGR